MSISKSRRRKGLLLILIIATIVWWFSLPTTLFKAPWSCVVNDSKGQLIGAKIAEDGQWRFPGSSAIPHKFEQAILMFEDEYFYKHPGFNPVSIIKAFHHNLTQSTTRGGSTITQQVIRLSRENQSRTYLEKAIELILSTRLEVRASKETILKLYTNHAPFGGNVVGLDAACWRYFGIPPSQLTWAQAASLAVLPNSPSLVYPGKNEKIFLAKRNQLLKKLHQRGIIDDETYQLSLLEELPGQPLALPNEAYHWTNFMCNSKPEQPIKSSLQLPLQQKANYILASHQQALSQNNIYNLAMIVVDNTSKQVKAYVGNQMDSSTPFRFVDMAQAKRSSGSTLKPFLYASAIEQSHILPNSLIRDVPISFDGYQPKNFNEEFHGLVPADEALSRSLNIPFVNLLYNYGLPIFYEDLQQLGLHEIDKGSEHYGLTLILGGAEVSLWELTKAYVNFKSIYTNYVENSSQYSTENISELNPFEGDINKKPELSFTPSIWSAASVYFSMEAMTNLNRPEDINTISLLGQEQQIAWKTGTSFGFKDAWSIGINDDYTIGVWVGNADAEGRPQLTGVKAAAPIMFDMFRELPRTNNWLQPPFDDLKKDKICNFSGWPVTSDCENYTEQYVPARHIKRKNCPYHVSLSVDKSEQFQVNRNCYPARELKTKSYVQLSPVESYYIKLSNFKTPPPMHPNCKQSEQANVMEFIYPRPGESIILPKSFDENDEEVALKLAHAKNETVYWYLDKNYLTITEEIHEISLYLEPGNYEISVVDSQGQQLRQNLTVKER